MTARDSRYTWKRKPLWVPWHKEPTVVSKRRTRKDATHDVAEDLHTEASRRPIGRPTFYKKPLAKTFMMSQETWDALSQKAASIPCSRSDCLAMAIHAFTRHDIKRRGMT